MTDELTEKDALTVIFTRNSYYRRQYLLALGAVVIAYLVIFFLIGVLVYVLRNPTEPLYFATDKVGRLITIVPVSRPNMDKKNVEKWAIRAVEHTYSYDYVNYRKQLQDAQNYFTNYGWRKYMEGLTASNNLVALQQRKMIFEAKVVGDPVTKAEGILGGKYAYKFEMPVLVTFWMPPYDNKSKFSNALTASIIVQRQPVLQSKDGLGVVQLIASTASAPRTNTQQMTNNPTG